MKHATTDNTINETLGMLSLVNKRTLIIVCRQGGLSYATGQDLQKLQALRLCSFVKQCITRLTLTSESTIATKVAHALQA